MVRLARIYFFFPVSNLGIFNLYAAGTLISKLQEGNINLEVKGILTAENLKTNYFESYEIV